MLWNNVQPGRGPRIETHKTLLAFMAIGKKCDNRPLQCSNFFRRHLAVVVSHRREMLPFAIASLSQLNHHCYPVRLVAGRH